jgi:pimeloyl-ACP methyl ester carboxylesterase
MQTAPLIRAPRTITGLLPDGAQWKAEVPEPWNGRALLYAHGYHSYGRPLKSAPNTVRHRLLSQGYALVASSYPTVGWAVAEAVPSQILALDAFAAHFSEPISKICWGFGMGGLVATAIAELHPQRIDGAMTICASSVGTIPMMNMALDGAFALTQLLMPSSVAVPITRAQGDEAVLAAAIVRLIKEFAQCTKTGRARLALAGVFGGVPGWTDPDHPRPSDADDFAQQEQIAEAMPEAVFPPRHDQEFRAGGAFSWNAGVDYRRLLQQSQRQDMIERLYKDADIDLQADLDCLAGAPRLEADPAAVNYAKHHFTPSGRIGVPVLTIHTMGDGVVSPSLQRSYVDTVRNAGSGDLIAEGWVERAGHCNVTSAELLNGLRALESRLATGMWHVFPIHLNEGSASEECRFVEFSASPMPRGNAHEPRPSQLASALD